MIFKPVPNPRQSSTKHDRISGLAEYIRQTVTERIRDKCIFAGAENFISNDPNAQILEMIALATDNVRCKDPVKHYVLSWPSGERPTPEQAAAAAAIFVKTLGLVSHQFIFAMHDDTSNRHLHLMVNRIHPLTGEAVEINKGFDLEAAHQAIARIEHAQGWRPEKNGRYRVDDDGQLVLRKTGQIVPAKPRRRDYAVTSETGAVTIVPADLPPAPRQVSQRARDIEAHTGEQSAERIAIDKAGPIIRAATSWSGLHDQLAEIGMRYEKVGSGAKIYVGEVALKASTVDRQASFAVLCRRLGEYEPPPAAPSAAAAVPESAPQPMSPELADYVLAKAAYNEARETHRARLLARQTQEKADLAAQRDLAARALDRDWTGNGDWLNAMRQALARDDRAARAATLARHRAEKKSLSQAMPAFERVKDWLARAPERVAAAAAALRSWLTIRRLNATLTGSPADLRASLTQNRILPGGSPDLPLRAALTVQRLHDRRSNYDRPDVTAPFFTAARQPGAGAAASTRARLQRLPRGELVPNPLAVDGRNRQDQANRDPEVLLRADVSGRVRSGQLDQGLRSQNQPAAPIRQQAEPDVRTPSPAAPAPPAPARTAGPPPPAPSPVPGLSPAEIATRQRAGQGRT